MARRSELEISQDRATIAKLLARGYRSNTAIANVMNESRPEAKMINSSQVRDDIQVIHDNYLNQGMEDYNIYRNKVLEEISLLQTTYWQAYELSRRNKITLESEAVLDEEAYEEQGQEGLNLGQGDNVFQRNVRTREEQRAEGNPAFLTGVLACIDRKAKIYGVDAPSKVALTNSSGDKSAIDLLDIMKQKMEAISNNISHTEGEVIEEESKLLSE